MPTSLHRSFINRKIIFGGAFDPPHLGHEEAIIDLIQTLSPEQISLVPTFYSHSKVLQTDFQYRYEMTQILAESIQQKTTYSSIGVSDLERTHNVQYSFQLLQIFKNHVMVIGTDQFEALPSWGNFPQVLKQADWLVLLRKPHPIPSLLPSWAHSMNLTFLPTSARALSSSEIRRFFAKNDQENLKAHLHPNVLAYVERNHLYGT